MRKLDVNKLALVASMLASPNEQERATAAKFATDMLKQAGVTWETVIRVAFAEREEAQQQYTQRQEERADVEREAARDRYSRWRKDNPKLKTFNGVKSVDIIDALMKMPRNLNSWESGIVSDIARRGQHREGLTAKQWEVIWQLGLKARIVRRAGA